MGDENNINIFPRISNLYIPTAVKVGSRAANNLLGTRVNDNPLKEDYLFPQNLIGSTRPGMHDLCHGLKFNLNSEL